ncbi:MULTISPECIES: hypothetical protein [Saccharopolyspora]|nr:hypothetical protein [Saccharopolyspora antimicrobica]
MANRDTDVVGATMSLFKKVTEFASSPQGKKVIDQAKKYATDPKNKEKIDQVKDKFFGGKGDKKN